VSCSSGPVTECGVPESGTVINGIAPAGPGTVINGIAPAGGGRGRATAGDGITPAGGGGRVGIIPTGGCGGCGSEKGAYCGWTTT